MALPFSSSCGRDRIAARWRSTASSRAFPILGDIWLKAQIAQFVRTLSTLLAGGTPLVPALHTSAAAIGSRLISSSVEQAAERVKEGAVAACRAWRETQLIPELALEMIEVGEASGALPAMLTSVAEFYEEEVSTRLQRTLVLDPDRDFGGHGRCDRLSF